VCTLTLAWQAFADAPVAVAANRDEALDRPSIPPERVEPDDPDAPPFVAPRDGRVGGTWIGYNEPGLFVGLTNGWARVEGGGERSRGLLVRDALDETDADAAREAVETAVERHRYDAFYLVVADAGAAYLLGWDGGLAVRRLGPGVHVVVNVGAALGGGGAVGDAFLVPDARPDEGRAQAENARAVRGALTPEPGADADAWLDRAKVALADHEYGVCVHDGDRPGAAAGFGTRSSSVVKLGAERRYEFADGPPCETAYEPVERQFKQS